jgi:TolB-like protein/class 3 adenylate cyclase
MNGGEQVARRDPNHAAKERFRLDLPEKREIIRADTSAGGRSPSMSTEIKKEIALEIAHVLFIDIVGYSKLSINEQNAAVEELNQIVRASEQLERAEAAGRLLKIATGDGMALVFYTSPEAPAHCALEISRALKEHPRLHVRMGIHSGPVSGVIDVNGRPNLAGAGLNMAQRVMDCGDAGHILVSKHVAEDLEEYEHWRPLLHDLGECKVKHGRHVSIENLYGDEVGNPQLPKKFQALKKRSVRLRWTVAMAMLLALAAIVAGIAIFSRYRVPSTLAAPEESIAVLPFENLSEDKANAYFTTGIQNEILTRLAKIAALKVISHTSTQQYPSRPGNLPEIARQLGVANVLEGSVQKAADQVHINVQLIRAATNEHLWAESYDRKLNDIFDAEAEVATAVADALKAKLSGVEQSAIQKRPTNSQEAYDVYLRGLAHTLRPFYNSKDMSSGIKYFGEAARLDPKFALAWAWLGRESALGYFNGIDTDLPDLRETAKSAADKAIELQPDLGEAYLAQGYSHFYCEHDYNSAISSYQKAASLSPNNSDVFQALGLIYRRKGQWQQSLDYLRKATEVDPRNTFLFATLSDTVSTLRQYSAALKIDDQILDIVPGNSDAQADKISIYQMQGNLKAAAELLARLHPDDTDSYLFSVQIQQWIYERRYADAIAGLKTAVTNTHGDRQLRVRNKRLLALLQQLSGDSLAAHATWQELRSEAEDLRRVKGEEFFYPELASAYVALGDENKAFSILEHLTAGPSFSQDVWWRAGWTIRMAEIAAQAGKKDLALKQLEISARDPAGVAYGDLKFNPVWDPLRGDPRFEQIVASLAPKQ